MWIGLWQASRHTQGSVDVHFGFSPVRFDGIKNIPYSDEYKSPNFAESVCSHYHQLQAPVTSQSPAHRSEYTTYLSGRNRRKHLVIPRLLRRARQRLERVRLRDLLLLELARLRRRDKRDADLGLDDQLQPGGGVEREQRTKPLLARHLGRIPERLQCLTGNSSPGECARLRRRLVDRSAEIDFPVLACS
jgi:hypothetical protein